MSSWNIPPLFESIYALILCCLVFIIIILQVRAVFSHWYKKAPRLECNAVIILIFVFCIYFFNFSNLVLAVGLSTALPTKNICEWGYFFTQLSYGTAKFFSLLFLLQRAKLAHTMTPLFSDKYFNKIFPSIVVIIWLVLCGSLVTTPGKPGHLVRNSSGQAGLSNSHCEANKVKQSRITFLIGAGVITVVVAFFVSLFLYPICKLMNTKKELLCDAITVSRTQFKQVLFWSLLLSTVSLFISLLTMTVWPLYEQYLFFVPHLDYFFDSFCTFLLLGRNRAFLGDICCCFCANRNSDQKNSSIMKRKTIISENSSLAQDTSALIADWKITAQHRLLTDASTETGKHIMDS
ncbi:hypothetical protein RFI_00408 [Reticulomyxa filosa]|uniref:G-protein coupled receptors family 1 profile domain-containing protein n=1 Tax=Reticulomyxa filosa TaxID=46433 RepID=X6PEX2_RETFI|nr:hypothetical protein RFI_00408 [Reticulomyxa filosa]|eukprot:ETO36653.1 hypothetical protein RFI_00408 [Reticulomyxa filosa]